mmetsp:Transcript_11851/g.39005  ORF Transcript_11851/g.39005 Transcript_11851/m.39005 type:complete len:320 (+) Transcript_11851:152-1111(+)
MSQLVAAWQALAFVACDAPAIPPVAHAQPPAPLDDQLGYAEPSVWSEADSHGSEMRLLAGSTTSGGGSLTSSSGGTQGFGALGGGTGGAGNGALAMLLAPIVVGLLEHHSECGDPQTCSAFARVVELAFGPSARPPGRGASPGKLTADPAAGQDEDMDSLVPLQVRTRWLHAYVEQLHRLRQFVSACSIVKSSDDELLRKASARSTTVNIGGMLKARPVCAVCELPVRGLHAWCQGCGHGGHVHHLRSWFEKNVECPAGCGHRCLVRRCSAPIETTLFTADELVVSPADGETYVAPGTAEAAARAAATLSSCGGEFVLL